MWRAYDALCSIKKLILEWRQNEKCFEGNSGKRDCLRFFHGYMHFQVILHAAAGAVTFEDCGKDDINEW